MSKAIRHHYVPCVLLSRFGCGEGRDAVVWVWDKATGRVWDSTVEQVAFQNDLYTLPQEALDAFDEPDWYPSRYRGAQGLEAVFADMEGLFGQLLQATKQRLALPTEGTPELDFYLRMLTLLEQRTPANIEANRQLAELVYNISALVEANRAGASPEPRHHPGLVLPFDENKHILLAQSMTHWDEIVAAQRSRRWSLWYSGDAEFVVSDCPVCRSFARRPENPLDGPAPGTRHTLFTLPLGHDLVMMGDNVLPAGTRIATQKLVAYCNGLAVQNAERFIYTRSEAFKILWYESPGYAFKVINSDDSAALTIDARSFERLVKDGTLKSPRRWGMHGGGELQELVPPENRISTEEMLREWNLHSS